MLVRVRGRNYFQYNNRNYLPDSKAFDKLVNAERKRGVRVFGTLKLGGTLYAPNPFTTGKGSGSPLVEIETNIKGEITKRGQKKLNEVNKEWDEKRYFVKKGKEYVINHNVQYSISRTLRNGNTVLEVKQRSLPANTQPHTLPDTLKTCLNPLFVPRSC